MSELIIFHNNRCSKSRQTLQILNDKQLNPQVVDYLSNPPSAAQLSQIIQQLGFSSARQLMRTGEEEYKSLQLANPALSEQQLIDAMVAHPRLIERPIVICGDKAVLGRPPENVLSLL